MSPLTNAEKTRRYRECHPERVKLSKSKYRQSSKGKAKEAEYRQTPEARQNARERAAKFASSSKGQEYRKKWFVENRDHILELAKDYHSRPDIKLKERIRILRKKYGENALLALERDQNRCIKCSSQKDIEVHHIDGNRDNNALENLAILCDDCHIDIHQFFPEEIRRRLFEEWMLSGANSSPKNF